MMNITNIATVSLMISGTLCAQDFKSVLKNMRNHYDQCRTFSIFMEVTVFDSAQTIPFHRQQVEVKREGSNYFYRVGENEMLMNDKYLVMVDSELRQISLSKRSLKAELDLQKNLQFNLDSVFSRYESFQHLGREDEADHFLVKERNGPIAEVHFFIDTQNLTLKKMAYNYRTGHYVSINFVRFEKDVAFNGDIFSESKYLSVVDNKVVPSRLYRHYNISAQ